MATSFTGEAFNPKNAIVLAGQQYDIGIRCTKWDEPAGYNGYTTDRSIVKRVDNKTGKEKNKVIKGKRYSKRRRLPGRSQVNAITQVLVHHSGADRADPGVMYQVLYHQRGLSVHFALEDDGRLWQFNDMIDRCWHAGKHNPMSIGVECCLYPLADKRPRYYDEDRLKRTGNLPHKVQLDVIHGRAMKVYCFPEEQWDALARLYAGAWLAVGIQRDLTAAIGSPFNGPPKFPRNKAGDIPRTLAENARKHAGLIGHLQCTRRKIDPAGFPWEQYEQRVAEHYRRFKRNARL